MGLFDKVFEKKYCDICGEKIGLLGNRKLEDGNLCKNCAAKLSPWFSERKTSTVAQIKDQLAYREENRNAVAAFHATRTIGKNWRLLPEMSAPSRSGSSMIQAGTGTLPLRIPLRWLGSSKPSSMVQ